MHILAVNGIEVTVLPGAKVLQVCELAGKEVPRFYYHETQMGGGEAPFAVAAE